MTIIQPHKRRLADIVETAYRIVCQQVAGQNIEIYNEASLQLHLSSILKSLGQLYEFSPKERFVIELEKSIEGLGQTSKSNGTARCDIVIMFQEEQTVWAQAFIELKFFKVSKDHNSSEATKDNRFALFMDLENLERYRSQSRPVEGEPLCYEIGIAQNCVYTNPDSRSQLKTGNGMMTNESKNGEGVIPYAKRRAVRLQKNYMFNWTSYREDLHCLFMALQ